MKEELREEHCYVCAGPAEEERVLVDIETAAKVLGVSRASLYRWMREQRLEWVMLPNGTRRIFLDSLVVDPPRPREWI